MAGDAPDDRTRRHIRVLVDAREGERIQKRLDQTDRGGIPLLADKDLLELRVKHVYLLGQHRVPEAVHNVRELRDDRRIDLGLVVLQARDKYIDVRRDRTRELLEHQMLILHLGTELRGLEQTLAVPVKRGRISRNRIDRRNQPFVQEIDVAGGEDHFLGVVDQAIMLRVEHVVNGCQADVLVHAAVAGNVVRVEQFVVVLKIAPRRRIKGDGITGKGVGVLDEIARGIEHRHGVVCDVVEEGVAGRHSANQADRCINVTLDQVAIAHDHHRHAVGAALEHAVLVGREQRHVVVVGVGQVDAENVAGLRLDNRPGGHAAEHDVVPRAVDAIVAEVTVDDQLAGCNRMAIGVEFVLAKEDLVRRMRRVSLVLVDERRGRVRVCAHHTALERSACHHHEALRHWQVIRALYLGCIRVIKDAVCAEHQRVVRRQGYVDVAVTPLGNQVQAVVEELAEEGHPGVEGGTEANVGRNVREDERFKRGAIRARALDDLHTVPQDVIPSVERRAKHAILARVVRQRVSRGVVRRLFDDQITDQAWVGIDDVSGRPVVVVRDAKERLVVALVAELCGEHAREGVVGCPKYRVLAIDLQQVVERAVNRAQAERHTGVGQQRRQVHTCGMRLRYLDLVQDELQIGADEVHAFTDDAVLFTQ
ncbi:hypothetical protein D3C80_367110 [compost metagenome]